MHVPWNIDNKYHQQKSITCVAMMNSRRRSRAREHCENCFELREVKLYKNYMFHITCTMIQIDKQI